MAYIAFAEPYAETTVRPRPEPMAPAAPAARFTGLEWQVVALARQDRLASLRKPGRLAIALGAVFGGRSYPQLADAKLEALRRMAVLSWHRGYAVAPHEVRAFVDAGWTLDQYELLLRSISAARSDRGRRAGR